MASTPSALALFPFQNDNEDNCLARTLTVNDTLLSAIRAFLVTRKGSRLGNMVGCFLPDIIQDLVNIQDVSGLAAQLKTDLTAQFPGVNFINVDMTIDLSQKVVTLIVKISFSTSVSDIQELEVSYPSTITTVN